VNGDYSASTAANWVVETEPNTYITATEASDADDDLIFSATSFTFPDGPETNSLADSYIWSNGSANVPDEEGAPSTRYVGQFKSVTITGGYSGVVRFQNNVLLESFSMSTGAAIAQENVNDLDRFLTVTNTFDWSAGVLNSDADAGTIRLLGATRIITGGDEDPISFGSKFQLDANATTSVLQFAGGWLNPLNDASGFVINDDCEFEAAPESKEWKVVPTSPNKGGFVEIYNGKVTTAADSEFNGHLFVRYGEFVAKGGAQGQRI
jgi:hypothetical protein